MPDWTQEIARRLRQLDLSPERESEICDELAQHMNDRYEELLASGTASAEARQIVLRELGETELAGRLKAVERNSLAPVTLGAAGGGSHWGSLLLDLRYGLRSLRMNPGFATVAILSLALGIGANAAIFQLLNSLRMRPLPVPNPHELALVHIANRDWARGDFSGLYPNLTNPQWEAIRDRQEAFSSMFAWTVSYFNLADGGEARYGRGFYVSGEFFQGLQVPPLAGRVLTAADDQRSCASPGVVLSYGFWQREFGGQPAVGRELRLQGIPFEVIGITPADFHGPEVGRSYDFAVPLCAEALIRGENSRLDRRHSWWLAAMGRLKPGWTIERAVAHLQAISPGIFEDTVPPRYNAEGVKYYLAYRLTAEPGATGISPLRKQYEAPLWMLLALAATVLVIACANLANLLLARATARQREMAVRLALGASRGRIIRQLLAESLLLAGAGALAGVLLAQWMGRVIVSVLSSESTPLYMDLSVDWRLLAFAAALAILTTTLFGVAPAIRAARTSPQAAMNAAGRTSTATRERFGLRRALVISQIALSLVLVLGALLFARSFYNLVTVDAGFQREGLLVVETNYRQANIPQERWVAYGLELLERVRALPGVESAATASVVQLSGNGWNNSIIVDGEQKPSAEMNRVSSGYFRTMGTPLLAGRDFDERDTPGAPKVAIVTESFVRNYFSGETPIGRTFSYPVPPGQEQPVFEIVGLVGNSKYRSLRAEDEPIAYYPATQEDEPQSDTSILVRSQGSLEPLTAAIRQTMAEAHPAISLEFQPFETMVAESLARERLLATLSGLFGLLAAILATVGLYGVISYSVARRTNEIGVRMALGATPADILRMVLREAGMLLLAGSILGALLALLAGRAISTLVFGLQPSDPLTLVLATAALGAVAVAASMVPANRAARLDPMVALREE